MKKSINQSTLSFILNGISILALLFLVFSLLSYSSISGKLDLANENRFALTYNANRFMNGSAYLTNEVRAFASTGQQEHYDNYWNEVNVLQNRDRGVAAMQEIGITSEEQKMIDDMSELSNTLVPLEDEAMKNVQAGNMQAALDYVYGEEYSASIAQINALKEQFLEALDERTKTQVETLGRESDFIRATMIAALIIVAVIQLLIMVITKRRVLRPVIAVRDQMSEISQGNLSAEFLLKSNTSEIGMLVESIHETKRELKKYIHDIDSKLSEMAQGNMDLVIGDDYRGEFLPIQDAMRQILDSLNNSPVSISLQNMYWRNPDGWLPMPKFFPAALWLRPPQFRNWQPVSTNFPLRWITLLPMRILLRSVPRKLPHSCWPAMRKWANLLPLWKTSPMPLRKSAVLSRPLKISLSRPISWL